MKGNINNCTSIDKYKLTKPFQKKMQKINIVFPNFAILNNWAPLNIYMKKWYIFNQTYFEHINLSYIYH